MQELEPEQLVELAGILVTLMIFYSIDAKYRFQRKRKAAKGLFRAISIAGGITVAVAALVVWVEIFLPKENTLIPVLAYFIPSIISLILALILAFEVLLMRFIDRDDEESQGKNHE